MARALNALLLLITIVGVYFVTRANMEFAPIRDEYARPTAMVDRMPIKDPRSTDSGVCGRHVISLDKSQRGEGGSALAIVDGTLAVRAAESNDWDPSSGSSWSGNYYCSTQALCDKPLVLIRIRFSKPSNSGPGTPDEPRNGAFLWIERK